jgi:DNA-binding MarR family transcriptional regulator
VIVKHEHAAGSTTGGHSYWGGRSRPLVGSLLRAPHRAVVARAAELLNAEFPHLRQAHMVIFQHIAHPPDGSRLTDLADRAQITKQSMGQLVDYLEQHGYLERVPDPTDRRAKVIRLTELGNRVHERAFEVVAQVEEEWAARFGAERLEALLQMLHDLNRALELDTARG